MKKSDYYRALIAGLGILMVSESAKAYIIPTVDANAIAEGIKTNIELVKQSKVVVEATKLTGEIKSITGEAKAALSDLENSEIAEELRKAQKEAENLQEAAATYQEYKEKIEQEKEKLEENKEKLNNLKDKATQTYTAAKEKYEEAKEVYNEAKSLYDEAKTAADTYIPVVENVVNTKSTQPQTQETTTTQTAPAPQTTTYNNTRSTQNTQQTASEDDELKDAQAEIEQLRAALAELMSQTKDDTAIQENSATITDLEEAQAEIERLKAELAKYQEAANEEPTSEEEENTNTQIEEEPSAQEDEEETTPKATRSFRQIPEVNPNEVFDKTSWKENGEIFMAKFENREVLKFAKEETEANQEASLASTPTGKNAKTDEFIMSDELALYCGINVNNASESELMDCVKKLIEYRSSSNATEAEKAEKLIKKILYDTSTALAAESMSGKMKAGNYKEEVIEKKKTSEDAARTTVRDDISALSSNVALLQELLSNINKIYASRLMAESLQEATKYKLQDIGESPSSDTTETETGEYNG